nr:hypothetical protein [Tanacetum cinerariifolium]
MGQTNQTVHMIMPSKDNLYNGRKGIGFENLSYFEKAKDLRPTHYDEKSKVTTTKVKNINGEAQLHVKVDGKKVFIFEASIRRDLQFRDEEGVDCLPNEVIFEQLTLKGSKTTAWNEFSSIIASAVICLATNQKFNFSKYIFDNMVKNLDSVTKFLMVGKDFSTRVTPLFPTMMVQPQEEMGKGTDIPTNPQHTPTIIQPPTSQPLRKQKPMKTKRKDKQGSYFRSYKDHSSIGDSRVESSDDEGFGKEDASKQRRIIDDLDADEDITLVNDQEMFNADKDLQGQEVVIEQEVVADKEPIIDAAHLVKIIPAEDIAIDAIPLDVKTPIINWKIYKEEKKSYYQIIRADGKSKNYLVFSYMFKDFDIEDVENLWKLVKAEYGSIRPEEDYGRVPWGDLKVMFKPHIKDEV